MDAKYRHNYFSYSNFSAGNGAISFLAEMESSTILLFVLVALCNALVAMPFALQLLTAPLQQYVELPTALFIIKPSWLATLENCLS